MAKPNNEPTIPLSDGPLGQESLEPIAVSPEDANQADLEPPAPPTGADGSGVNYLAAIKAPLPTDLTHLMLAGVTKDKWQVANFRPDEHGLAVQRGFARVHRSTHARFFAPLAFHPVHGTVVRNPTGDGQFELTAFIRPAWRQEAEMNDLRAELKRRAGVDTDEMKGAEESARRTLEMSGDSKSHISNNSSRHTITSAEMNGWKARASVPQT